MDTTGSVTTHRQHTTRSQPTTSAPDSGVWDSNRHTRTGTQPTTDSGSVHEVLYGDAGVGDDDSVGAGDGDTVTVPPAPGKAAANGVGDEVDTVDGVLDDDDDLDGVAVRDGVGVGVEDGSWISATRSTSGLVSADVRHWFCSAGGVLGPGGFRTVYLHPSPVKTHHRFLRLVALHRQKPPKHSIRTRCEISA